MTNLIETIDTSLAEIEEQMLAEFSRIRNTVSEHRFGAMDTGIKNALLEVLNLLHHDLEHSGDAANLQLLSTHQENLFTRMVIIRQLLNARIPTAFLHDAHDNIEISRQRMGKRATTVQQNTAADITITNIDFDNDLDKVPNKDSDKGERGLMHLIKSLFQRKPEDADFKRKRLYITEREAKILVDQEIYLDKGVYSAAKELAMLANMIGEETKQVDSATKPAATPAPTGKAIFESRDVSVSVTPATSFKPLRTTPAEFARSPEAIRQKLAARQASQGSAKASFGSRYIEPAERGHALPPLVRKPVPASTGRAIFASRDIEPAGPVPPPQRPISEPAHKPTPEPPKPTGKAIFESRDVGQPPTKLG